MRADHGERTKPEVDMPHAQKLTDLGDRTTLQGVRHAAVMTVDVEYAH